MAESWQTLDVVHVVTHGQALVNGFKLIPAAPAKRRGQYGRLAETQCRTGHGQLSFF